jgi:hypothetical protein
MDKSDMKKLQDKFGENINLMIWGDLSGRVIAGTNYYKALLSFDNISEIENGNKGGDIADFIPTNIIYNDPATIAYFSEGSKVISECSQDDEFTKEGGVEACIIKKLFGDWKTFHAFCETGYVQPKKVEAKELSEEELDKEIADVVSKIVKAMFYEGRRRSEIA